MSVLDIPKKAAHAVHKVGNELICKCGWHHFESNKDLQAKAGFTHMKEAAQHAVDTKTNQVSPVLSQPIVRKQEEKDEKGTPPQPVVGAQEEGDLKKQIAPTSVQEMVAALKEKAAVQASVTAEKPTE